MCTKAQNPTPSFLAPRSFAALAPHEQEALIAELTTMVHTIAKRIARRVPRHVEIDDLLSAGMIGLFDALQKFDSAKATDIRKYTGIRIQGAILDELRAQDPIGRCTRKKMNELETSTRELTQELGRAPTQQEMARHLEVDIDRFHALRDELKPVMMTSIEALAQEGGDVTPWVTDGQPAGALEMLEAKELRALLERELGQMKSERHQMALRFCYFDGMSNREIAKVFGISESRASQLLADALAIFGRRIRAELRARHGVAVSEPPPGPARGVRWQLPPRELDESVRSAA